MELLSRLVKTVNENEKDIIGFLESIFENFKRL